MANPNMAAIDYRPVWAPCSAITVVPADGTDLVSPCRKLVIGGPTVGTLCTVKVRMLDGSTPTFSVLPGTILDIQFDRVFATGTTATLMIALY